MAPKKVNRSTGKTKRTVRKYKADHKRSPPNDNKDCNQEVNLPNQTGANVKARCPNCGPDKDFKFDRAISVEFEEKTGK